MSAEAWLLLVEDSPSDRELARLALTQATGSRFNVRAARDGVEALDLLFCRGAFHDRDPLDFPRAILLDVNMPLVNGFEVLREIKAHPRLAQVPVVMLTSSAERRDLVSSYELGQQLRGQTGRHRRVLRHLEPARHVLAERESARRGTDPVSIR